MTGSTAFTGLLLAGSLLAPALPPRQGWVGETVLIKRPGTTAARLEPDGSYSPAGQARSIQYVVTRDVPDRVQVMQDGQPVWIEKAQLVRLRDAVEYYTKQLDGDPNNDVWFAFRGWARFRQGQTAEALKDYAEAIRLDPRASNWYSNRGVIQLAGKKVDEAIADFTAAVDLTRDNEFAYRNRAAAYARKKDYAKAAADYARAVELNPQSAFNQNQLAWTLATVPDEKVRDGNRAVEVAKKACELTGHKNGGYLDTLAAAYAEVGRFAEAVEWQEKALKVGDMPIKDQDGARKRLELYKQKKPYRGEE
jgi:tetratricopeptide (TPR) repeat protein